MSIWMPALRSSASAQRLRLEIKLKVKLAIFSYFLKYYMLVIRFCKNIIKVINLQSLNDLCISFIHINLILPLPFIFSLQMSKSIEKMVYSFVKPVLVSNLLSFQRFINGKWRPSFSGPIKIPPHEFVSDVTFAANRHIFLILLTDFSLILLIIFL